MYDLDDSFVAGGGDLKSKLTHDSAGVLSEGECVRKVDGPAEELMEKLHLSKGNHRGGFTCCVRDAQKSL